MRPLESGMPPPRAAKFSVRAGRAGASTTCDQPQAERVKLSLVGLTAISNSRATRAWMLSGGRICVSDRRHDSDFAALSLRVVPGFAATPRTAGKEGG